MASGGAWASADSFVVARGMFTVSPVLVNRCQGKAGCHFLRASANARCTSSFGTRYRARVPVPPIGLPRRDSCQPHGTHERGGRDENAPPGKKPYGENGLEFGWSPTYVSAMMAWHWRTHCDASAQAFYSRAGLFVGAGLTDIIEPNNKTKWRLAQGGVMTTLYEILQEVAPKRALFTSYTYSAVWFEAAPYPLLHKGDCEQITVMLDAREARASVDNTTSRFGGSRYRVVSTTPTNEGKGGGIFHPKIAYLESDDGDVFVVSSANLTTQGQSRSLEVVDAVMATTDPMVFGEIADFLELLPARLNLLSGDDEEILAKFARRARAQRDHYAANAVGPRKTWLVTTLADAAGPQFVDLARQHLASPKSLTALSPYFDKDVGAVVRLRDKLGVKQVRYGLARKNDELIAPFLENVSEGSKPDQFVEPPDNGRLLHAKWFEVVDANGEALVMTGSVNATQQSLWSTKNIEVSLVRHVVQSTTATWAQTDEVPRYIPCEYPAPLASDDTVNAVAHITRHHVLEVCCSPVPVSQEVLLDLHHSEAHLPCLTSRLDGEGRATMRVSENLVRDLPDRALWLTVRGADFEATTWVNVEPQLSAKPKQVDLSKSIGRIEDDVYDDDDAYLLLNAAHLLLTQRKLNSKGRPQSKEAEPGETESEDPLVTEAQWLAGQGAGTKKSDQPSAEALRIFKALGKLLEMSDEEVEKALLPDADDEDGELEEAEADSDAESEEDEGVSTEERRAIKKRQQRRESVAQARIAVQVAIDKRLAGPMPDALAILAVPQKIRTNLRAFMPAELREVDTGRVPPTDVVPTHLSSQMMGLLSTLVHQRFGPTAVDNLLPMVASVGAITALCHERRQQPVSYDQIRSAIEMFAGRQLSGADYQGLMESEWNEGRIPLMVKCFAIPDLFTQAVRIASAPRVEDRIDSVLALAFEDSKRSVSDEQQDIAYVVQALRQSPGRSYKLYAVLVIDIQQEISGCPQCFERLDERELKKLKTVHMAVCRARCKRPIFLRIGSAAIRRHLREDEACIRDMRPRAPQVDEKESL